MVYTGFMGNITFVILQECRECMMAVDWEAC